MAQHPLKFMLFKTLFGFLLIFSIGLHVSDAGGQSKDDGEEILVIGSGNIKKGNLAVAREKAVSDALSKGVEKYLTTHLGREGIINNFPRLINDIVPGAKEQIENYHIFAEYHTEKHYKILVGLKVNKKVMDEKLKEIGLITIEGPPLKILFLVSESVKPFEAEASYWWKNPDSGEGLTPTEVTLNRTFQEHGFIPINRLLNVPEEDYSDGMRALDLSDGDAIKWGRLFSSDVVIHGKCEIVARDVVSVTLKAFNVERGRVILQDTLNEMIGEDSEAKDEIIQQLEMAINSVALRFAPEIIKAIGMPDASINKLDITLKELQNFKQFWDFRGFLEKNIEGVHSVIQTRISNNSISVSVEYSGEREGFLSTVLHHDAFPFPADGHESEGGEMIITIKE